LFSLVLGNNKKPKAASAPKDAPTKGHPRASGKKSVATDENTTGGPSSKYTLHNHRKKKVWNNASIWDFIPGVCMKKWKLNILIHIFFQNKILFMLKLWFNIVILTCFSNKQES